MKKEDLNMRHLNLQIQYYVFKKLKEKLLAHIFQKDQKENLMNQYVQVVKITKIRTLTKKNNMNYAKDAISFMFQKLVKLY